ncbi:glutamine amidotransferase [Myxococcota bacterium]|nr:glutamine amidotransferase [Myxococcota bacterium]MBU1380580.1 glutamine amidotransferase [Myxococcota bacterium]MBU1497158.1 glutamine amidotransferase [Myxococcota bacterium]
MKVYFYLLDTMADWEYGFLASELSSKRYFLKSKKDLEIITVSCDKKIKTSMGGFKIIPDIEISEMVFSPDDFLILPGGDRWFEKENEEILIKSHEFINNDMNVAAICGATIGLAKHGALDSKFHTSNNKDYLKMVCPEYQGDQYYKDSHAVNDKNLITASGIAPLEFSYEVLKNLHVFSNETLKNWYNLYDKKQPIYFHALMKSLEI